MPASAREMHHERRQREHHAGGQIDLAHDHQHDLAAGDDRHRRDVLRQVLQAGVGQQERAGWRFRNSRSGSAPRPGCWSPASAGRASSSRRRPLAGAISGGGGQPIGRCACTISACRRMPSYRVLVVRYGPTLCFCDEFQPGIDIGRSGEPAGGQEHEHSSHRVEALQVGLLVDGEIQEAAPGSAPASWAADHSRRHARPWPPDWIAASPRRRPACCRHRPRTCPSGPGGRDRTNGCGTVPH